jgi:choice-of-anchor B domain-containing protein
MPGGRAILLLCGVMVGQHLGAQVSRNVSLVGRVSPNPFHYAGCWTYVAPDGREYGLVGGYFGTHVIALDSATLREVGYVAGPESNWREITVLGNHAFVVSEGGGPRMGMQVISLAPLPDSVHLVTTYRTTFTTGHMIMRDTRSDSPYVYISGASATGGVHILNVANPAAPVQVGVYDPPYYIHDAHIRGTRLYASAGGMRQVDIVDIANKANPTLMTSLHYPGAYTHSCWTTDDNRFLFVADEQDGQPARLWNIENLNAITEVAQYTANPQSLVHNLYIRGMYAFVAHNTEGLRVVDLADPTVPVEVGYYDTYPGPSGGFNGLWSACPFLPSGRIIGGDRTGGLYVWRFTNVRAGRIYGTVRDSLSSAPIDSARITILETGRTVFSTPNGFKIGELPGSYTVSVSAAGFFPSTFTLSLTDGDSLWRNVVLRRVATIVEDETTTPRRFLLHQNFPNPFNPSTTIMYQLEEAGSVVLNVYDAAGREIASLVRGSQHAGTHQARFDASNLSSGVYFYSLHAAHAVQTRRMTVVR